VQAIVSAGFSSVFDLRTNNQLLLLNANGSSVYHEPDYSVRGGKPTRENPFARL
jgi:hypothetical protein